MALSILLEWIEKNNNADVILSKEEVEKLEREVCEVRISLGDFFMLKEDIPKGIEEY